jgi:hypothetical protein
MMGLKATKVIKRFIKPPKSYNKFASENNSEAWRLSGVGLIECFKNIAFHNFLWSFWIKISHNEMLNVW